MTNNPAAPPKVGFVSLGCPKALVDSERIMTELRIDGYELVGSYADAEFVVVNTCGFIDSAKAESLETIGEALDENGRVIVTGCLGVHEQEVKSLHPGVLSVTGPSSMRRSWVQFGATSLFKKSMTRMSTSYPHKELN